MSKKDIGKIIEKIVYHIITIACAIFIAWVLLSWAAIIIKLDNAYNFFNYINYL